VIFSIRVHLQRLVDVLAERDGRAAFAQAWAEAMGEAGATFRAYKRLDLYDALVTRLLGA
jgi:hypothetical protein